MGRCHHGRRRPGGRRCTRILIASSRLEVARRLEPSFHRINVCSQYACGSVGAMRQSLNLREMVLFGGRDSSSTSSIRTTSRSPPRHAAREIGGG